MAMRGTIAIELKITKISEVEEYVRDKMYIVMSFADAIDNATII